MIKYEQLDSKTDGLRDVKLITDDAQAEMAALTDTCKSAEAQDTEFYKNLLDRTQRNENGNFEIIIPGDEVGETSDLTWEVDGGMLEDEMERWNTETLAED